LANVMAQPLERRHFRATLRAAREMPIEKCPLGLGNFAIEIGVEPREHLFTTHLPHPFLDPAQRGPGRTNPKKRF
jgi:hypothetical protein